MMIAWRIVALWSLLAGSVFVSAQEIRFVDLSLVEQRAALRTPPASPPNCKNGKCVGGGSGGVLIADGAPDVRDPHVLGVSLDSVMPTDITLEPFLAEFRVLNTGLAPIEIPISPHLSDLQPSDETKSFTYFSLALVVNLHSAGPPQAEGLGYVELYGSPEHEGTIVALKPGQWVRIKANVKMHTWPSKPVNATLQGDFWLRQNTFVPHEGGSFTDIHNLYPNHTLFPGLAIHFDPTRSLQNSAR